MPTLHDPGSAAAQLTALVARVRRRTRARDVMTAVAFGLLVIAGVVFATRWSSWPVAPRGMASAGIAAVVVAIVMRSRRDGRSAPAAARRIERRYATLRNLAVTAEELIAAPDRARPYMRDRVMQEAARATAGVDPARVVPLTSAAAGVIAAGIAAAIAWTFAVAPLPAQTQAERVERPSHNQGLDVDVVIEPPAYANRAATRLRNPASIDALSGSTATISANGVDAAVRVNGVALPPQRDGSRRALLVESGYVAIDTANDHRVLPLTVRPDAKPDVRVTAPGKDLRVADARGTIAIHATASDDLDLRSLEVRYTVVSGGGEQFTFVEGTLPVSIARESARAWHADAALRLPALKLEPGDALIYRAVAADARPGGAGEASSDTYFVEIAGPGDVALEGVEMPPDKERYALSEAMIVVKIQRLLAKEAGMKRADLEETAANIAAEQRAVRANFIFLLGGEVEDEIVEAEASHEIQEGRLANQARREIVAATVLMAKVEQALAAVSARTALPLAQEAVRTLQRAFGHSRYLLRALPARIRIDPSRRLSGDLATIRDWSRELTPAAADASVAAARSVVSDLAGVSRQPGAPDTSARLTALAERTLAIEPGAADLQAASRILIEARDALSRGDEGKARAALQRAAAPLVLRAQRGRHDVPFTAPEAARLAGAAATSPRGSR